jgi:hypothetical protein
VATTELVVTVNDRPDAVDEAGGMLAEPPELVVSPVDPSAPADVTGTSPMAKPSPIASAARLDRRAILHFGMRSFMQSSYALERRTVRGGTASGARSGRAAAVMPSCRGPHRTKRTVMREPVRFETEWRRNRL